VTKKKTKEKRRTKPTSCSIQPPLLRRLDELVEKGYFHSRSEAIRVALLLLFREIEEREKLASRAAMVGYR